MHKRNLLILLGEWWEEHQSNRAVSTRPLPSHRWLHLLPTPGNVIFTLLVITGLLWAQSAGALPLAAPNATSTGTIAYQGRLADTVGAPLTGTYNMTFRLYSAASGGAPLWEEPWNGANSVQVSDGLFNVMLGSLAQIPASIITANSSLFLGITVGTDSEMSPRVQLGSVPFAVQALTVPDGSVTTGKIADGAVVRAKLGADVSFVPPDGSITAAKIADGAVTSQKQSATTYYLNDNTFVQALSGETKILSEFNLQQAPAGDIAFYCSFIAYTDAATGFGGQVLLQTTPGGDIATMPTHIFSTHWDNYVLHGRLSDFGGGNLTVRIRYTGEGGSIKAYFGAANGDFRFSRKCTVIAGL